MLKYDSDNDTRLNRGETRALVDELTREMGVDLPVVAGILLMAPYSATVQRFADSSAAAADAMDASHDARMRELFVLFDEDLDGEIEFTELVTGLMRLMPKLTVAKAKETALQGILMCDASETRTLDFAQVRRTIQSSSPRRRYRRPARSRRVCGTDDDRDPDRPTGAPRRPVRSSCRRHQFAQFVMNFCGTSRGHGGQARRQPRPRPS